MHDDDDNDSNTNTTTTNNHDAFPTYQITILAICRFSEPIAFNSILAYTYKMVQDLNGTDHNASFYAGLLVSAYAIAEALTSMFWGAVSDRYGRKPVVLLGLCGVAVSCLLFGLARQYWVALAARFIGGALNGNVSVMQTMVAEMVLHAPQHEPRAYAMQPFVWILGSMVGSAVGGFLAQPAEFYPGVFARDGLFGRYPYLLPNLVSVVVIVLAVAQGILFLEETNPRFKKTDGGQQEQQQQQQQHDVVDETTPFLAEEGLPTTTDQRFDLRRNSFGTMHSISVRPDLQQQQDSDEEEQQQPQTAFNFTVIMFIISLVIAAFHQMGFGTLLPIYLLDAPSSSSSSSSPNHHHLDLTGGMGMTLHDVGTFLAGNGLLALLCQGVLFPLVVERIGIWPSFFVPTLLYPLCYLVMPFLTALRGTTTSWPLLLRIGIYATMFVQNLLGILAGPCALILLKNATPSPLVLGRVNGLAMSVVCVARTVSSPLVGVVYDAGGNAAAWWGGCTLVAVVGAAQLWWVPRESGRGGGPRVKEVVHVENALVGGSE